MARWVRQESGAPLALVAYDADAWGRSSEGIRAWGDAARAWLKEDPARRLPFGTDGRLLDQYREQARLIVERGSWLTTLRRTPAGTGSSG
jgi:hypothetical protein